MHFAFTPDQLEIRDTVRTALKEACTPSVLRQSWAQPSDALWPLLAEVGVLGLNAPESIGGMEMGAVDWVLVLEESGRFGMPEPVLEAIAAMPFLVEAGLEEMAARLVEGRARISICVGDGYAVDADRADLILKVERERIFAIHKPRLISQPSMDGARRLFAVDGEAEGLDGDVAGLMNRATLACSAQLIGLGRHVLDAAVSYSKERRQFGKPIGSFQAVQHHLVDALLKLKFAAPMVYRAAWSLSEGHPDAGAHIAMAKIFASEAAQLAARKSLQVHGAIGYTDELDLQLWMKRIWALSTAWGSPAQHRERVALAFLGEDHATSLYN